MINSKVKTKDGYEPITAYFVSEAVLPDLQFVDCYRGKRRILSCADYAVFDSETSHYGLDCAWIYQWAFLLGGVYVYGRTAAEFVDRSDMYNVQLCLERTCSADLTLHLGDDGRYTVID